jgi:hypothetical protein
MLYSPKISRNYSVKEVKEKLMEYNIPVRPWIEDYNVWEGSGRLRIYKTAP